MYLDFDDDGPGPVVVLLHGFPLNRTMWESQQTVLGSVYRVVAPDLRGQGRSEAPDGVYTMDVMADDVIELLDRLKIVEPVVLGGLSMGGYVALSLATRFPERWRGLVLFDTRATADSPEAARGREDLARQVEAADSAEPAVAAMMPKLFSPITRAKRPDRVTRMHEQMLKTPPRGVAAALRGMAVRPDRTADLARIDVPTLVVVGADDIVTPPAEAQRMASALPRAQLVEIADAGHLSPYENPAPVNEVLLEFLRSLG